MMDVREIFDRPPRTYDRSPKICPAGRRPVPNGSVAERLRSYLEEHKIAALKHEANIPDKEPPVKYKLPYMENKRHHGIFVESYRLFIPPMRNRYQTMVDDLKETSYQSYWTKVLGTTKDPCGNLPGHINPEEFTFGMKYLRPVSVADLVSPNKLYGTVLKEHIIGHDNYKKSHNSYYVSEKKDYNYKSPSFNRNQRYGEKTLYDQRGIWLKDIMHAKKRLNKYAVTNYIQSERQSLTVPILGVCKVPNASPQLPDDLCLGSKPRVSENMATLLTENIKSEKKYEIEDFMSFINTLRNRLKKRFNKLLVSFDELFNHLKYFDKEHTGWIPYETAIEICICYKVNFDKEIMRKILISLNFYKDGYINYKEFLCVINWQEDFPTIGPVYHNKPEKYYYETEYRNFLDDMNRKVEEPTAGVASIRYDLPEFIPPEMCMASDLSSYGGETLAGTIMYPSVYTSYGLSHRDLFQPRPKLEIFNIFMRIGYIFNEAEFEQIWKEAVKIDKSEMVCANTFKTLLDKHEILFDMQPGIVYEPEERQCYVQDKTF